jgi:hypothetical protein
LLDKGRIHDRPNGPKGSNKQDRVKKVFHGLTSCQKQRAESNPAES